MRIDRYWKQAAAGLLAIMTLTMTGGCLLYTSLTPIYEEQFSDNSFGFRPGRGAHDALERCRKYINEGYVCVVSMDLQSCFDTVSYTHLGQRQREHIKGS